MRGTTPPVSGARTSTFFASSAASGSEKLASSTLAFGFSRASRTARWMATMVLPVPAEPATRAGPEKERSTSARCEGWRKTPHFSHGNASACSSSSWSAISLIRRSASGCANGIGDSRRRRGRHQPAGGGVFEQRFGGLGRQVRRQREETVLAGRADVGQPVGGHADGEQRIVVQRGKQRRWGRLLLLALGGLGKDEIERRRRGDFLHALAHLDDLDRAGARMRLDPPAFGPSVGVVVVADIGDQQALARLVNDQADVAIDARRPEIGVLAVVDAVQLKTVAGRVHLKIEDARLHGLLVEAADSRLNEAVKVSAMRKFIFVSP